MGRGAAILLLFRRTPHALSAPAQCIRQGALRIFWRDAAGRLSPSCSTSRFGGSARGGAALAHLPSSPPGAPAGLCRKTAKLAPCDLVVHVAVEPRSAASPWSLYPTLSGGCFLNASGAEITSGLVSRISWASATGGKFSESTGECEPGAGRNRQRALRVAGRPD